MVDMSPDAAKKSSEVKSKAAAEEAERKNAAQNKQLADLQRNFGTVGSDGGQYQVGFDQYGNYILQRFLVDERGNRTGETQEVFFYVAPNGTDFKFLNASAMVKKLKEEFKNDLEGLRKNLYNKQFLSKADFETKDETAFNRALILAARNHSVTEVQKYTINGATSFSPFNNWLSNIKTVATGEGTAGSNLPTRDINLQDRTVIEAIIKDVYSQTTDMAIDPEFLKQETDRYMKQIEEGTLTTIKTKGGENVRKTTKGFTQAQVQAELPERIKKEQPGAMNYKNSFNFLAFLDGMGAQVI